MPRPRAASTILATRVRRAEFKRLVTTTTAISALNIQGSFTVIAPEKPANDLDSIRLLSNDHPSVYVAISIISGYR